MKRKLHDSSDLWPVLASSTSTVHRAASVDQRARTTLWSYRIRSSMPCSFAVSCRYARMDGPSAMAFPSFHGRKEKPRVYMSESERMPG